MEPDKHLTRHIRVIYPELLALFDAGEAVESLVEHPGWLHIVRLLDYEIATVDARLDRQDTPLSQAEYAMAHGRRGGLQAAASAAEAILSKSRAAREEQRAKYESGAESPQEMRA